MRWEPTKARRFASLLITPARVLVGLGAAVAVLAGIMPWAEGVAPAHAGMQPVFFSGLGGSGDGVVLLIVAAATGVLTLYRTPAESRVRSIRLAPAILVALAAMTWINGYRAAVAEIAAWGRRGGHGGIAPGLWLAGIGILAMAAGCTWLLPQVIRWHPRADDPADIVSVGAGDVAAIAGGLAGTFVGAGLGITAALGITGPSIIGMIALGAVFGGLLGAYGGTRLARGLADRLLAVRGGRGTAATAPPAPPAATPVTTLSRREPEKAAREFRGRVGGRGDRDGGGPDLPG